MIPCWSQADFDHGAGLKSFLDAECGKLPAKFGIDNNEIQY
jgi:hypothetical protein